MDTLPRWSTACCTQRCSTQRRSVAVLLLRSMLWRVGVTCDVCAPVTTFTCSCASLAARAARSCAARCCSGGLFAGSRDVLTSCGVKVHPSVSAARCCKRRCSLEAALVSPVSYRRCTIGAVGRAVLFTCEVLFVRTSNMCNSLDLKKTPWDETCTVRARAPARAALCAGHTDGSMQYVAGQAAAAAALGCLCMPWLWWCGLLNHVVPATTRWYVVCSPTRLADRVVTGLHHAGGVMVLGGVQSGHTYTAAWCRVRKVRRSMRFPAPHRYPRVGSTWLSTADGYYE